ncbi:glutamate 5-kinase [Candidatus Peregrinibacteria bacterium]|nr:glutamate 5-kinase [Candidatus Peregrinibacteria bacterium]
MKFKTIVIKVGTALVTKENNSLDTDFLKSFVKQIAELKKSGAKVLIVTSGAVASGRSELVFKREDNIPCKQALAAVGQGILMNVYRNLFSRHNIATAQVLLTNLDFKNRESFINTRNTLDLLMRFDVIPIINENDVTAYAEIKFGDNDNLSAKLAAMVGADSLIILTTVKGFYTDDPTKNPKAELIREIRNIDAGLKKFAKGAESKKSLGGMASKLAAAEFTARSGIKTYIAAGTDENILRKIISGEKCDCTVIYPSTEKHTSRQNWFKSQVKSGCAIIVNECTVAPLKTGGKSLLPVGIIDVRGKFSRGDFVEIIGPHGKLLGLGQSNYSSNDLGKIKGCKTPDACKIFGVGFEEEAIHRDNMVIL